MACQDDSELLSGMMGLDRWLIIVDRSFVCAKKCKKRELMQKVLRLKTLIQDTYIRQGPWSLISY